MGTIFPLFTTQLFDALGYPIGTTVFACVAVLMIPIPFVRRPRLPLRCTVSVTKLRSAVGRFYYGKDRRSAHAASSRRR